MQAFGDLFVNPLVESSDEDLVLSWETPQSYDLTFSSITNIFQTIGKGFLKKKCSKMLFAINDPILSINMKMSWSMDFRDLRIPFPPKGFLWKDHKQTVVYLLDGDFYFQFVYDDLSDEYAKRLEDFRKTLETFMYNGEQSSEEKGTYNIPNFSTLYEDVRYHLYESEITALASKIF